MSIYKRITTDLIINRPLPSSTGYTQTLTNIGEIQGNGIELDLNAVFIKATGNGFNWETNVNFTTSKTEVTDLGLDTDKVVYSGFSNLGNVAQVGHSLTSIFGPLQGRLHETYALLYKSGSILGNKVFIV